jgi:hypothetical protein
VHDGRRVRQAREPDRGLRSADAGWTPVPALASSGMRGERHTDVSTTRSVIE